MSYPLADARCIQVLHQQPHFHFQYFGAGVPQHMGGSPQLQMNGTSASAIHALPTSLPGQATTSALTQKLAGVEDHDQRRTMLGKDCNSVCRLCCNPMAPHLSWLWLRTMILGSLCQTRLASVTLTLVTGVFKHNPSLIMLGNKYHCLCFH